MKTTPKSCPIEENNELMFNTKQIKNMDISQK